MKFVLIASFLAHAAAEGWLGASDTVSIVDLMLQGATINVENCGEAGDAMQVKQFVVNPFSLRVEAVGMLSRDVTSGTVSVKTSIGGGAHESSLKENIARRLAFLVGGKHKSEESLCNHVHSASRGDSACPFRKGSATVPLALNRLPPKFLAGSYTVKTRVSDGAGGAVLCFRAALEIPRGPRGEAIRQLRQLHGGDCVDELKGQAVQYLTTEKANLAMVGQSVEDIVLACHHEVAALQGQKCAGKVGEEAEDCRSIQACIQVIKHGHPEGETHEGDKCIRVKMEYDWLKNECKSEDMACHEFKYLVEMHRADKCREIGDEHQVLKCHKMGEVLKHYEDKPRPYPETSFASHELVSGIVCALLASTFFLH